MQVISLFNWTTSASRLKVRLHRILVNPELLHADAQSFKRLDRNCVAMLVVGMAAFNSWTACYLRDKHLWAIRLPALSTGDSFRSSATRSTIAASLYRGAGLTNDIKQYIRQLLGIAFRGQFII